MGIALPNGDIKEVFKTVKTNDYMGWKPCTMEEARAAANSGTAAIGISDSKIVVLAADDAEEPIESTAEVLAITDSTPAVTVTGLQYYSYSYGGTGCGGITTTISTEYCGGSNYRDVTKHKMVLQCDGYYVCSKCGYRVKSPSLQDKGIFNDSDYFTIVSLLHEYLSIVQQFPIYAEKMLYMIDAIRGLPENKTKYEYCDKNGIYVPEYNISLGNSNICIHVNKGSCVTEWVLLKTLYSIISAATPFPYSVMLSAVSDLVARDHPGVTKMTGADIAKNFASYIAEGILNIPNIKKVPKIILEKVKNAADIYFFYDDIEKGISCTNDCYNINISVINKDEFYDCHQIKYHFSNGVETMGRYSEYNVDGIQTVYVGANYYDHVNNREYDVYR